MSQSTRQTEDRLLLVLTLLIAATTGLVVVAFVALTEHLSASLADAGPLRRFLSPLLGALVGGFLLFRFFPEARGSGIPQTRVALLLNEGYIGLRTVIGKFLCSSISLGSGIALGREGPSVHIGAGIASVIARRLGLSEQGARSLIPVGTAAAVAAAFNTPLAAVLFSLEEILADLHARLIGSVVLGAATSWIVLRLLLGDEPIFHVPAYRLVHPVEFLFYAILGVVGGLVSTLFVKSLLTMRERFLRAPQAWKPFSPAIGGLVVGTLALAFPGVLGVGYNLVGDALNGQLPLRAMLLLLVLKLFATSASYSSGNAGGVFGPSLFIGAMLGGAVGHTAHQLLPDLTGNAGAYALVGMGAAFAGIIRTPMTSVIMIFEITRDYTIIVPLMIANLCSFIVARRFQHTPLYEALLEQEGIRMPSDAHRPDPLPVSRAFTPFPDGPRHAPEIGHPRLHPDDSIDMALQLMGAHNVAQWPVLSRVGTAQLGVIHFDDAVAAYRAAHPEEPDIVPSPGGRNWLRAISIATLGAILVAGAVVFWQRSNRVARATEAFQSGQNLLQQGRPDEAVQEFRFALASQPADNSLRAALGLALVESGHYSEAAAYLRQAAQSDPTNGPVRTGLARVEHANGNIPAALSLMKQGLASQWPAGQDAAHTRAQMDYAAWLYAANRKSEAALLLLPIIEQSGDNSTTGKLAAEAIRNADSPARAEEAFSLLAARFPADPGVLLSLAQSQLANNNDAAALETLRRAAKLAPSQPDIAAALESASQIVDLDPAQRRLSLQERGRRWHALLERAIAAAAPCGDTPALTAARRLAAGKSTRLDLIDAKSTATLELWRSAQPECRQDPVLAHILARIRS